MRTDEVQVDGAASVAEPMRELCVRTPGLRLLVLHGSRARGDGRHDSDWDFGYLATPDFDLLGFMAEVVRVVGADRIDLADLDRSSALLRHRVARDGVLLFERQAGLFQRFQIEASLVWCDLEPVLRRIWASEFRSATEEVNE